ncbi:sulfatase-like hydrolase/transferase [Pedobacter sp. BS3]|uniref:LTA synthase family protein n=1 Tax=Pedobacter sp. BS3 TaxID=2567937 RepID=UPI0011EF61FE|nr:alkaline phosphatase family protein [Pedobacter sp. BS3]TZF83668.1 sulfatase-like hydrolase/transferase [Pedobacter sp. BS3]
MSEYWKGNIYKALILRLGIILVLFTLCRLVFYRANAGLFNPIGIPDFLTMLWGGLKFDISAIMYVNLLFIVSQIIPFRFRYGKTYQKISSWIFYVTNGIALAMNVADVAYYPFTLKRTTFTLFSQFANEENKGRLLFKFIFVDYWYITLFYVALLFAMVWLYRKIRVAKPRHFGYPAYYLSSLLALVLVSGCVVAGIRGGFRHSTRPITLSNAGEYVTHPDEISIVINTPFSIIRTIHTQPLKKLNYFSTEQLNSIYNPVKQPADSVGFRPKNIVIIIWESLSREYVGSFNPDLEHGNYKGYAPFIDSLKQQSLAFDNAYANGRKSIEALPSVISSIPGINEPFVLGYYSGNKISSIGGLLKQKGYYTAFFHGAPNGSMGFSSYIKMAGIEHYYGKTEYNNDADFDGMWGIWDEPFLQYFAKTLNTFKQPFFSAVFTLSSHHPFKVPEKYEGKFPKGTLPVHQGIGYTDMALKEFFATASKMPWYKNTIFVITADHSSVAWHDEYKTSLGAFAIPILIFDPSGELKGEVKQPVQQADIMPSLLNYLHFDKPYFAFGNDMIHYRPDHFIVQSINGLYQVIAGDYVLQWDGKETVGLYNYREDILLQHNLRGKQPEVQQKLEQYIKAFLQQYNRHMVDNALVVR